MRSLFLRSSVIVGLVQVAACGGSAPEPAATPTVTTEPVAIATSAEPAAVRVAPVAEPADVIGVLQWKNPQAMVQTTAPSLNVALLQTGGEALVTELFKETLGPSISTKELARLIAIDAPVTGLVALHPNVKKRDVVAAYSVGLRSIDEAKQLAEPKQLTETSPGVWRIEESSCLLAALPAPMAARLVCSDSDRGLEALAPYMVRTMPFATTSGADLHIEVRVGPAEARYGDVARQLISQAPLLAQGALEVNDRDLIQGLTEAISGVGDDVGLLMRDVNTLAFDVSAAPTGVTSRGYLTLHSTNSWTAQTIVRNKDHSGAPPAIFWRLPKDSESAYYGVGDDPNRYTDILRVLRRMVYGGLGELKFGSDADRKAVSDLLRTQLGADVVSVSAKGGTSLDAPAPSSSSSDIVDSLLSSWAGWTLMGSESDPQVTSKYLKDFVATYNRPGIQAALKRELMPLIKFVPTVKAVPAPAKLGAGAMGVEFKATIPAGKSKAAKAQAVAFVLYTMADGQRTWMAMGTIADKDELVKRLLSVKASAPTTDSLASREGLERLKQSKLASGGFMTMAPLLSQLSQKTGALGSITGNDELKVIRQAIQTLPNHGATPIPLMVTTSNTEAALSVEVPRAAINDLAHLVTKVIAAMAGGSATP